MGGRHKSHNPRRIPATYADVKKAKKDAIAEAVAQTRVIFLTVLRDKEGYDYEDLLRFWDKVNYLSEEIIEGYVTISDLRHTLREEAGIDI